jgi:hypothetical protein
LRCESSDIKRYFLGQNIDEEIIVNGNGNVNVLTAEEIRYNTNRFREFGLRHFGNSHLEFAATAMKKSRAFFRQYHSERMELKMFLENETFTLCPVPMQFSLFDLPVSIEFILLNRN